MTGGIRSAFSPSTRSSTGPPTSPKMSQRKSCAAVISMGLRYLRISKTLSQTVSTAIGPGSADDRLRTPVLIGDTHELGLLEYLLVAGRKPGLVHDHRYAPGFRRRRQASAQAGRIPPQGLIAPPAGIVTSVTVAIAPLWSFPVVASGCPLASNDGRQTCTPKFANSTLPHSTPSAAE